MWVSVIALAAALAGLSAGAFTTPPHGVEPLKGNAATTLPTPSGGSQNEITRQPTEAQGEPGQPTINCPVAQDVTSRLTTTVSGDRSMGITSTLHVAMSGVAPPHPPLDIPADLQTTTSSPSRTPSSNPMAQRCSRTVSSRPTLKSQRFTGRTDDWRPI